MLNWHPPRCWPLEDIVIEVPTARLRLTSSAPEVTIGARYDRPEDVALETLRTITKYMGGTTFAIKEQNKDWKPVSPRRELRDDDLIAHAVKKKVIACYPMAPGSDKTQCAALDFDNHDGLSSWEQMVDAAREVIAELKNDLLSPSLVVRSRNGQGIHLWLLFVKLAHAKTVRAYLNDVLERCGFTDGEGGVANRKIEIFPKQDSVEVDGYGNHITLPFAGSSVALDRDSFEIMEQVQITTICGQPYRKPKAQAQPSSDDDGFNKALLLEALRHVSADERATRIDVGMAIKNSAADANFDDQEAFQIWADWTDTCTDRLDTRRRRDNWRGFKVRPRSHPRRLTLGTVYKLAADNGWIRPQPTIDAEGRPIVRDEDHVARARRMRDLQRPHMVHYRDDFMDFAAGAYHVVEDGVIVANTWTFLDGAQVSRLVGRGKNVTRKVLPFQPDRNSVGETIAALKAVTHLNPKMEPPCWLNGRDDLPCGEIIAFPNGLLDLRNNILHPVDPNFFTVAALGFDYVSTPQQKPAEWLKFLDQIFDGDDKDQQIAALQEMFGYLLTADTSQEKAFLLLGPKRSGKGTMLAMLRKLLASSAVIGPTLKSLGSTFGLMPLIGKQLAIIDDLRVGAPKDQELLIENVLKITGRGLFTIDRKYKAAWTGTLPTKLVLVSNLMPKLGDDSAALASRFITFVTRVSFYDREDPQLFEQKLAPELVGVLHWALEGLRRLHERGRFQETATSKEARERLAALGSPAKAFITERCVLDVKAHVEKSELYNAWCDYCRENNSFPGTLEKFCEALYAAAGGLVQPGRPLETMKDKDGNDIKDEAGNVKKRQINACVGIKLQDDFETNPFMESARQRASYQAKGRAR